MGKFFFDQYSLLHYAIGIVVYFFGIPLNYWVVIHTVFEIIENTQSGIEFIDKNLPFWPGGKESPDSLVNSFGDLVFATLGWLCAYGLDIYATKNNLNISKLI